MMRRVLFILTTAVYAFSLCSCSTILNSTTQQVELTSNPANAKISIDGSRFGTSPQVVNIDRGADHVIKYELDGFEVYETKLTRKISHWFWLNVTNGLIPGMLIDMFTGSMYNILPEKFEAELTPAKVAPPVKKK